MNKQPEIFFHPGFGKTGTTYLQYRFFPKLEGIFYIPRTRMHRAKAKLRKQEHERYLVSREHDRDLHEVIQDFIQEFPQAKIIFVLRRQDKWIASQYRRQTKNGRGILFEEYVDLEKNEGMWDYSILYYFKHIQYIEEVTGRKPLVLFQEELTKSPHTFFDKIATYLGASYDENKVSLRRKHKAYSDAQLKAVRKVFRPTYFKKHGKTVPDENGFQRRLRKTLCHLVLYFHFLVPLGKEKNEALINPESQERVRAFFAEDWEKCQAYAEKNNVEVLLREEGRA